MYTSLILTYYITKKTIKTPYLCIVIFINHSRWYNKVHVKAPSLAVLFEIINYWTALYTGIGIFFSILWWLLWWLLREKPICILVLIVHVIQILNVSFSHHFILTHAPTYCEKYWLHHSKLLISYICVSNIGK